MRDELLVDVDSAVTSSLLSPAVTIDPPAGKAAALILGPGRSASTPTEGAAVRMRRRRATASSIEPWARGSRATSIPAKAMLAMMSGVSDAGPIVATMRVLRADFEGGEG